MTGVLTGFGIIATVIAIGFIVGKTPIGSMESRKTLQMIAFFVANPALMFGVLAHADLSLVFSSFMSVAAISAIVIAAIYAAINAFFWQRSVAETTIGALAASYVNGNNIGLPVAIYVLGDAQYVAPLLLMQLVLLTPLALTVLDISTAGSFSPRTLITRPLSNPMIVASFLGLIVALIGVDLPDEVYAPFELIGGASVPLMLLAFGMSLSGEKPFQAGAHRVRMVVAAVLKSAVMPVVAYVLAAFVFGLEGHALFAAVALAALPTAQNIFTHATRYQVETTLARDTALATTVAAVPVLLVAAAFLG